MRFGIVFANTGPLSDPAVAAGCMRAAEAAGFESAWTVEHVVVPVGYESEYPYSRSGRMPGADDAPIPDPLVWSTYVAAVTERLVVGTGILILPQRNTAVVAKELATLDRLSGGRLRLGVGVGWLREEFDALGIPFEGRGRRLDAQIAALRSLWSGEPVTLDDGFHRWESVISQPTPVNGSIPIVIGGHSEIAARRAGRIGDGFFPGRGTPAELAHLFDIVRESAVEAGRNPDAIEFTAGTPALSGSDPLGAVEEMASLGVGRIVVPPLAFDPESAVDAYGAFGERIIAPSNHR